MEPGAWGSKQQAENALEAYYNAGADNEALVIEVITGEGVTQKFEFAPTDTVLAGKQGLERDCGIPPTIAAFHQKPLKQKSVAEQNVDTVSEPVHHLVPEPANGR
jgi:hypothetical protein